LGSVSGEAFFLAFLALGSGVLAFKPCKRLITRSIRSSEVRVAAFSIMMLIVDLLALRLLGCVEF
jgi:hypothetical protein